MIPHKGYMLHNIKHVLTCISHKGYVLSLRVFPSVRRVSTPIILNILYYAYYSHIPEHTYYSQNYAGIIYRSLCWTGRWAWNWNYCSPCKNVDTTGTSCLDDSPCDKRGYPYNWCYNDDGSWHYCGKHGENFESVLNIRLLLY